VNYLTKSKFKLASECPTKLFYTGKSEYINNSMDNPFLEALADGGYQVGELAKYYHPNGYHVHTLDYDEALEQTSKLLEKVEVTIYEAAVKQGNLFIRVDILIKRGSFIKIIEVKAKSIGSKSNPFLSKNKDKVSAAWSPYLFDVAFQRYVARLSFPDSTVTAYLLLIDKSSIAPTDGINQKFKISVDDKKRKGVCISSTLNEEDLSVKLLRQIPVDIECDLICNTKAGNDRRGVSFISQIKEYSESFYNNTKINTILKKECRDCEFKASQEDLDSGFKSGFHECWKGQLNWTDKDFEKPNVLDIWDCRKKDKFIQDGKIKFSQFYEEDINPSFEVGDSKLCRKQRQWLQIEKVNHNDSSAWIDKTALKVEMDSWTYPLHFIDFETAATAIPFNKGRHPYEGIAFQFSHHIVYDDGRVEHKGEYINTERGAFPNYEFVRRLKIELGQDNGTIFKYSPHENTYLNMIYEQLQNDDDIIYDKEQLCDFIQEVSHSKKDSIYSWKGERDMVDMLNLVKWYFYDPATNGSNSIKHVLPAILNSSDHLKEKYSKPIYGTNEIPSKNFNKWTWIKVENEKVVDPYKLLPTMFQGSEILEQLISTNDEIKDGGAAMTAYAKMQFEEMSSYERDTLSSSLLKYCELDTMAMVMIYESWKIEVSSKE
jgi:hypothetical protein